MTPYGGYAAPYPPSGYEPYAAAPIRHRAMQRPPTARRTTILTLLRRTIRGITPPIPPNAYYAPQPVYPPYPPQGSAPPEAPYAAAAGDAARPAAGI